MTEVTMFATVRMSATVDEMSTTVEKCPRQWGNVRNNGEIEYGLRNLKPIFHKKTGLRRVQFASANAWNVHAQRKDPMPGTQRNLYSTGNGVHVG